MFVPAENESIPKSEPQPPKASSHFWRHLFEYNAIVLIAASTVILIVTTISTPTPTQITATTINGVAFTLICTLTIIRRCRRKNISARMSDEGGSSKLSHSKSFGHRNSGVALSHIAFGLGDMENYNESSIERSIRATDIIKYEGMQELVITEFLYHGIADDQCARRLSDIIQYFGIDRGILVIRLTTKSVTFGWPVKDPEAILSAMKSLNLDGKWVIGCSVGEVAMLSAGTFSAASGEELESAHRLALLCPKLGMQFLVTEIAECFFRKVADAIHVEDVSINSGITLRGIFEIKLTPIELNSSSRRQSRARNLWSYQEWQLTSEDLLRSQLSYSQTNAITRFKEDILELSQENSRRGSMMSSSSDGGSSNGGGEINIVDYCGKPFIVNESEPIGSGCHGKVLRGIDHRGSLVALKLIPFKTKQHSEEIVKEIEMLSSLKHPNILPYISCALVPNLKKAYIITQYVSGGSLDAIRRQFGPMPPDLLRRFLRDILNAVKYLHSKDIIHGDIKPHNVLLDSSGACKLADFGSAFKKDVESAVQGSPMFMAPEHARGNPEKTSDVWSIGVVALFLAGATVKFTVSPSDIQSFIYNLATNAKMNPIIPATMDPTISEFVQLCVQRDHTLRPKPEDLLKFLEERRKSMTTDDRRNFSLSMTLGTVDESLPRGVTPPHVPPSK